MPDNRAIGRSDAVPVGTFRAAEDGVLLDADPELARMLGFSTPEELLEFVGTRGVEGLCEHSPERNQAIRARLRAGRWAFVELRFRPSGPG